MDMDMDNLLYNYHDICLNVDYHEVYNFHNFYILIYLMEVLDYVCNSLLDSHVVENHNNYVH